MSEKRFKSLKEVDDYLEKQIQNEKRFEFKLKVNFIDEETGEEIYHKVLIDNSNGNEIRFDDMVGLLNEFVTKCHSLKKGIEQLKERVIVLEKLISDVETSEGMSIDNLIDTEMIRDE